MATISEKPVHAVSNAVPGVPALPAKTLVGLRVRRPGLSPHLDQRLMEFVSVRGIGMMRLSLAIVFVWFGIMKTVLPNSEFHMVIETTYWFPLSPKFLIPGLGVAEILIGAAILFPGGVFLRLGLVFILLHLCATFMVLILMPDHSFQNGNPLLLIHGGEFVMKNLVLIAAALVVLGSVTVSKKKTSGITTSNVRGVNGHQNGAALTQELN